MSIADTEAGTSNFILREMKESDIDKVADFINECARLEAEVVEETSPEEMRTWMRNPINHGRYFIALGMNEDGSEGQVIGEGEYNHAPGIEHAWGWMHVHPDHRLKGVGTAIYDAIEQHARSNNEPTATYTPSKHADLLIAFLERRGYEHERWYWELQLPADTPVNDDPQFPEGITVRTFARHEDELVFLQVRNVSFAEHYGSVQRTLEEIIAITDQPDFRPEGLFFAFDGDKVAGFCLTDIHPDEIKRRGIGVGHINLLGTMPEYRGKGIGRALLLTGIQYLRLEVPIVELSVEGKNSNALALYYNVGFKEHKVYANMVKAGE